MRLIDASNAEQYLHETHRVAREESLQVRELSGGVSNFVLLARRSSGEEFVLKQARPQLRVPLPWFCGVARIFREIDVLRLCERTFTNERSPTAPSSALAIQFPRVLFEDRENFLFGMTAAPSPHETWKERLLSGDADGAIASACGDLLGRLHAATWRDAAVARQFDDRQFFDDLRIDPYFRQIALVHADLRPAIQRLIDSVWENRFCLVHGDFSPKNLLVWNGGLMLIDFEVGHFGDPAFDLGFVLTHLVLKSLWAGGECERYLALLESFWSRYATALSATVSAADMSELESRTAQNLAGCCLARVDGKSRVDYLADGDPARELSRQLFQQPPGSWNETYQMIREQIARAAGLVTNRTAAKVARTRESDG